jgi:hypothetical protein
MTVTTSPSLPPSPSTSSSPSPSLASRLTSSSKVGRRSSRARRGRCESGHDLLGRYADAEGHAREVVALPGPLGSVLVVDRDASTLGDRRLVAHLSSDEPPENAAVVCEGYLKDSAGRWGRRVTSEDLETPPLTEEQERHPETGASLTAMDLTESQVEEYRLQVLSSERCNRQLRWCRCSAHPGGSRLEPVSVRDVIASLENYEPVRSLTVRAIAAYRDDPELSVAMLRSELDRVDTSPFVLNRGLREVALRAVEQEALSMSEIAMRCGRVKRDPRGRISGETSWLARRLGILPSAGEDAPTPWVRSDVLALIAREGLRVSPREVELG